MRRKKLAKKSKFPKIFVAKVSLVKTHFRPFKKLQIEISLKIEMPYFCQKVIAFLNAVMIHVKFLNSEFVRLSGEKLRAFLFCLKKKR